MCRRAPPSTPPCVRGRRQAPRAPVRTSPGSAARWFPYRRASAICDGVLPRANRLPPALPRLRTGASGRFCIHMKEKAPLAARSGLEEGAALVLAEHVAHRAAGLTDRGAVAQRVLERIEEVAVASGYPPKVLQAALDHLGVPAVLEPLEPLELALLGLRVDLQDLDVVNLIGHVLVDADDDVLTVPVALVVGGGGLLDLALDELQRPHRAAELLDLVDQLPGPHLDLVS